MLWLSHHSFEELRDALEYYLAEPNSDLEADLTHLNFLVQQGVHVTIHPFVTIYIRTLLAWDKCFLATYGEYPGLYDLLNTPRSVFLAAQLHLHDSTFARPLLPNLEAPYLQNEPVALQPFCMPVYKHIHPLTHQSVMQPVCQSSRQTIRQPVHL